LSLCEKKKKSSQGKTWIQICSLLPWLQECYVLVKLRYVNGFYGQEQASENFNVMRETSTKFVLQADEHKIQYKEW